MAQIGRISGQLLKENLLRNGVDLAFETDLLYLQVPPETEGNPLTWDTGVTISEFDDGDPNFGHAGTATGIGVRTDAPAFDLDVNGTFRVTQDMIADVTTRIGNIIFNSTGTITTQDGPIIIEPLGVDPYVEYRKVLNTDLELKDNYIKVLTENTDLIFDASGTGIVDIQGNSTVAGDLAVQQNITVSGNVKLDGLLIVGDSPLDTVTVVPDFTQSIEPGTDSLYNLGASANRWGDVYVSNILNTSTYTVSNAQIGDQLLFGGNTFQSLQSNDDIFLQPSTGITQLERIEIDENDIINLDNTPLKVISTGNGYVKFSNPHGIAIPIGNNAERGYTEIGETRWNTDLGYMECFDGTVYQVATGGGRVVTPVIMEEFGHLYTLIFG